MSMLSRFAKLDSALQRGLDNGFAAVFGGRVVPAEIEELLKQEIDDNLQAAPDGRVFAPNVFVVGVSSKDMANLTDQDATLPDNFADQLARYCRNNNVLVIGPVVVRIAEEPSLRTGQLRVSSYEEDRPEERSGFDPLGDAGLEQEPAPVAAPEPVATNDGPTVSLLLQDGSSRTYTVREGSNILGRSTEADLRLPDTGVSREHAEITWDGQDAVLVDLESTNGTTVNDTPIDNWLLADGDVITIGHSTIEVRITFTG